jgi:hypothetical protein
MAARPDYEARSIAQSKHIADRVGLAGGSPERRRSTRAALGERGYIFVVLAASIGRVAGLPETVFAQLSTLRNLLASLGGQ